MKGFRPELLKATSQAERTPTPEAEALLKRVRAMTAEMTGLTQGQEATVLGAHPHDPWQDSIEANVA